MQPPRFPNSPVTNSLSTTPDVQQKPSIGTLTPASAAIQNVEAIRTVAPEVAAPTVPTTEPETASALSILQSLSEAESGASDPSPSIPEFALAAPKTRLLVGRWQAKLSGDQKVVLSLAANGEFRWLVSKGDKASEFTGRYQLSTDRLSLVRSKDLQQMTGAWKLTDGQLSFQLEGDNAARLAFTPVNQLVVSGLESR